MAKKIDSQAAAILLENLIQRSPELTDIEREALGVALESLREARASAVPAKLGPEQFNPPEGTPEKKDSPVWIDASCLQLPPADDSVTMCIDFGTAMSKAAVVDTSSGSEKMLLLELGAPTDQSHVSEALLVSSVYIATDGVVYFGQAAVEKSQEDALSTTVERIDNMKRFLSEGDADDALDRAFNPTEMRVTARRILLAYLAYLTWACSECVTKLGYPRNIIRKFAVPCLTGERKHRVNNLMSDLLGWAQLLADTLGSRFLEGIALSELLEMMKACERIDGPYHFVGTDIAEPIAVAASYPGPDAQFRSEFLAIDVGAGTTDFGLFKVAVSAKEKQFFGSCPPESLKVVKEAGNYLDRALLALILSKAGLEAADAGTAKVKARLALDIRELKESLFIEGFVYPTLPEGLPEVEVTLDEFCQTSAVESFTTSIEGTVQQILDEVNPSWLTSHDYIGVLLTGGGAGLPMLQGLLDRTVSAQGRTVKMVPVHSVPKWLEDEAPYIAEQYPRVAVALGGARPYAVQLRESSVTAGDVKAAPMLQGYYQKGQ
jgi:hypothetical protein